MNIIRLITAGNVDDGKSTLIGKLLFDTGNISSDVLDQLHKNTKASINLAHITDGLREERNQGITIDVAYKYFSTKRNKYILIDAPGHFHFTKNLVTGASNADVMIILIDIINGITLQTRRHLFIASILKIQNVIIAINKIDLVQYDENLFNLIKLEIEKISNQLKIKNFIIIPISALIGDNIIYKSKLTNWYQGFSLMEYIDQLEINYSINGACRFNIQHTTIHNNKKLVFGYLLSGKLKPACELSVNCSSEIIKIKKITTLNQSTECLNAGESACIQVAKDSKLKRGDVLAELNQILKQNNYFNVQVIWMSAAENPKLNQTYIAQFGTKQTSIKITKIQSKIDLATFNSIIDSEMQLKENEFGQMSIVSTESIVYDENNFSADTNKGILIDPKTFETLAVMFIH
jgi:sulfate adenylyltransferase subunit 1